MKTRKSSSFEKHPPQSVKNTLSDLGVRPSKQRGQNFVTQPHVIDTIFTFGAPQPDEPIVEIGGGLGALTEKLAGQKSLTVVEIEPEFCAHLQRRFPNATVVNQDARAFNFSALPAPVTVFGNIPYIFSTEIIFQLVEHRARVKRAILLVQKEFADRVAAEPGGRDFGVITIMVQLWATVRKGPVISGESFHPPTKVESRVMEILFHDSNSFGEFDPQLLRRIVKAAFHQRRRMISNSLLGGLGLPREVVNQALEACAISPQTRPETVAVAKWVELSRALSTALKPA